VALVKFYKTPEAFLEKEKLTPPVVFTNGCFDILHLGHARYLKASRALGNSLVIGLNSDLSVQSLKGPLRPIYAEQIRAEMLLALACVDAVVLFHEDTPEKIIEKIRPNILTKGGDYQKSSIVGAKFVESLGGQVIVLPFEEGFSTSGILKKLNEF
jgi:D-beta-D-heptose 7-phosphate kinase/D-beta-D-heptose 1-phosphate adenosyltransferase